MKLFNFFSISVLSTILLFSACTKDDLEGIPVINAYDFATLDENGGTFKQILLPAPDSVLVEAPDATTSATYALELNALKNNTRNISDQERKAVTKWGGNAVVRWNQIALDLAAKYNVPPSANADGTYPGPNSADPSAYPNFPVATPPYTARALAYMSTATYDALISCWHYKYLYNRSAPSITDPSIETLLPSTGLPSYPSEDAVIGAVAKTVLTAMFPLEADYINDNFEEQMLSRKTAGMNVQSDLSAGDSLGRQVARKFLARAKADGMGAAGASAGYMDTLKQTKLDQFGWAWESQDSPKRGALLPKFGKVKPWCFADITTVRPPAPPAPGSPEFVASLAELHKWIDNPTKESREIANFWADGPGTYTPPGHWNRICGELVVDAKMNPLRSARTFCYLNMAIMDAGISCWDAKYYYFTPRPSQDDPTLYTVLGIPNFPGYTSGHSTFSGAAAAVLGHIFPASKSMVDDYANKASMSRIYGGIHHTFDCTVGLASGYTIGNASTGIAILDGGE